MSVLIDKFRSTAEEAHSSLLLDRLFYEHWSRLYGVIFRLVGDQAEAEDLALEAFWRLHQKLDSLQPVDELALRGWLYRVGTNLGLNALRARKRRRWYELKAGKISLEASHPENPAAVVERAEARQQVWRILSEMKPRSAKILIFKHSGLTYAEIAATLRVSQNSVGKLLARAERDFEKRYRALEGN